MRITEDCSCGATIAVEDEAPPARLAEVASQWRTDHRHEPRVTQVGAISSYPLHGPAEPYNASLAEFAYNITIIDPGFDEGKYPWSEAVFIQLVATGELQIDLTTPTRVVIT